MFRLAFKTSLKLLYLFWFIYLCLSFSVNAQGKEEEQLDTVTLQLKWYHQFQFAGYYAAKTQGFYKEAGLDVKIKEISTNSSYKDVLSGKANFGVGSADILLDRMKKKRVVALGSIMQHSPDVLIVRYDSGIRVPSDFVDKKILLAEKIFPASVNAMFYQEKIPLNRINISHQEDYMDKMISNKSIGITAYIMDEVFHLQKRGVEIFIIHPKDYGIDFYSDILFTTEQEIDEHPDRVHAFVQASFWGWEYAMSNVDEIIDYILELEEVKKRGVVTREYLEFESENMKSLVLDDIVPIGHMNPGRWEKMAKTFVELGIYRGDYDLEGFIYNPESHVSEKWKNYLLLVLIVSGIVLSIFSFLVVILRKMVRTRTHQLNEKKEHLEALLGERTKLHHQLESRYNELQNARNEIQNSEKKYKDLVENSQEVIFSMDKNNKIIAINKAINEHLRYSPNGLIGKPFMDIVYKANGNNQFALNLEMVQQRIIELVFNKQPITCKATFATIIGEPKEMNLKLEYIPTEKDYIILGKIFDVEKDVLRNFCESESIVYCFSNYLYVSDLICHRVTTGVAKYSDEETAQDLKVSLKEILINAIEHGNLNIGYQEKSEAILNGTYMDFLLERQNDPRYKDRKVCIEYTLTPERVAYRVTDQGDGFDYNKAVKRGREDMFAELGHGRGIQVAKTAFDKIEYSGKGNTVFLEKYF